MCCHGGKVILDAFPLSPPFLMQLLDGTDDRSVHFIKNIRPYNNLFQMTSFGHMDASVMGWNPSVCIQGQVYHLIGSLLPQPESEPNFLQVFFLDSISEQANIRGQKQDLNKDIIGKLTEILNQHNGYVTELKSAKDAMDRDDSEDVLKIVIREDKRPQQEHSRRFNQQSSGEVAILMDNEPTQQRDIVIRLRDGRLQRISELHRAYDTLQYPLMFPYGTDGYSIYLLASNDRKVTQQQYYSFHLQLRQANLIHRYARLFQQLLVDWYCKLETEHLQFIRREQKTLRADNYGSLHDSLLAGDGDPNNVGQRIVLPATFTGGPCYMHERQSDAMAFVRKFGCADLFITMTCNTGWKEITDNLLPTQTVASDRPELIARVFKQKLKTMMKMISSKGVGIFGGVRAWLYSIEFQKRGLPHAHILVWLTPENKIRPDDIDLLTVCA